jgi:CHAD domain-containing protein
MKARKVKGLDPAMPFAEAAQRIAAVRAQEGLALARRAQDPAKVKPLHDRRIAAKRLRYLLELTGPADVVKPLRRLQDQLGELHDCDVQLPEIRALARAADEREAKGLRAIAIHLARRRAECFERFLQDWPALEPTIARLSRAEVAL